MLRFLFTLFVLGATGSGALFANESKLREIASFLKDHVSGRETKTDVVKEVIGGGKLESEYQRSQKFSSVKQSNEKLVFSVDVEITQTTYDLNANGKRDEATKIRRDRSMTIDYELQFDEKREEIVGRRVVSKMNSGTPSGPAIIRSAKLDGNKLEISATNQVPENFFDKMGKSFKGDYELNVTFEVENGRTKNTTLTTYYVVDENGRRIEGAIGKSTIVDNFVVPGAATSRPENGN